MAWEFESLYCGLPQKIKDPEQDYNQAITLTSSTAPTSTPSRPSTCEVCIYRKGLHNEQEIFFTFGIVITGTLVLNSKCFCALFDLGATRSCISTQTAFQLYLKSMKVEVKDRVNLPNNSTTKCPVLHKQVLISTGGTISPGEFFSI